MFRTNCTCRFVFYDVLVVFFNAKKIKDFSNKQKSKNHLHGKRFPPDNARTQHKIRVYFSTTVIVYTWKSNENKKPTILNQYKPTVSYSRMRLL